MMKQIAQFQKKYNVRSYTFLLLGLLAVTNNALAAAAAGPFDPTNFI